MDAERQGQMADFVGKQLVTTPKTLRIFSVIGLLLCGFGLTILAGVSIDGAAGLEDTGLPLVFFGAFTALSLVGVVLSHRRIRSIPTDPLIVALRSNPRAIARIVPTTIVGRGGQTPALSFELGTGRSYLVIMGELTRAEIMAWLSQEGARVG